MSMEQNGQLELSLNIRKDINYVNYQAETLKKEMTEGESNSFSFLRYIEIKNASETDVKDVWIRFAVNPERFLSIDPIHISFLEKKKRMVVNRFAIHLDIESLYKITEKTLASIKVSIENDKGEVLAKKEENIAFLPIDESASNDRIDEILASFVTPNDPSVIDVLSKAQDIAKEKYGRSSFEGYLLHDPNKILEEMDAIYTALKGIGIRYSLPPASFESTFQKIRLPRDVIANKIATCIDFSILFASVLEAAGIKPIILMYKGHCNLAAWLDETCAFYAPKEENSQTILNNASKGFNNLVIVEATHLAEGMDISFHESTDRAYQEFEKGKNFQYALDISSCRHDGILPIPSPKTLSDGSVSFDFPSLKNDDSKAPTVDLSSRRFLDPLEKGRKNRFDYWEDKLLDLNLRNRLISYKSGANGIELLTYDPEKALSFLSERAKVTLVPSPSGIDSGGKAPAILSLSPSAIAKDVDSAYTHDSLLAVNFSNTSDMALKNLSRKSNTALEESGCNPLFLTIGLIRWFDNPKAAENGTGAMYAPIFLLPVKMPRRKSGSYYYLEYSFDDLQLNKTAFEYFKEAYDLDLSRLNPLPKKSDGLVDLRLIYNEIRNTIAPMKNWALIEKTSALSLFSFSHYVMWNDLRSHRNEMMNHPIVASFVYGEKKWNSAENLVSPEEMDAKISPSDFAAPLPADSSQIKAIIDAEKGESFVLDGPPGTGKSQTIANMIVNFLYHGKKVLFVAEKEVALNVVKRRLDDLHLGQFVLELANLGTPKSDILSNYSRLLELGQLSNDDNYDKQSEDLLEKRKNLNSIMSSMHTDAPYFLSPYDAIVSYLDKEKCATPDEIPFSYVTGLSYLEYKKAIASLDELARLSMGFGGYHLSSFLAFQKKEYSLTYREKARKEAEDLKAVCDKLRLASYNALFKGEIKKESRRNVEAYLSIIATLQNGIPTYKEYYLDSLFLEKKEAVLSLAEKKLELAKGLEKCSLYFNDRAYILSDVASLLNEFKDIRKLSFFKRFGAKRTFWKKLKPYFVSSKRPKDDILSSSLEELSSVNVIKREIEASDPYAKAVLKPFPFDSSSSSSETLNELKATFAIASELRNMEYDSDPEKFVSYISEMGNGKLFGKTNETLKTLYDEFLSIAKRMKEEFEIDISLYGDASNYFGYVGSKMNDVISSLGRLSDWTNVVLAYDEAAKMVPESLMLSFRNGKIPDKNLSDSYVADVCFALLTHVLSERGIGTLSHEKTLSEISSYQEDIKAFQNASIVETAARITAKFPIGASSFASSTSAYQLSKLAKNGGRGCSLRHLFHEYRDLISVLTPCFMMSPATLAQYLDPNDYHFDAVIFDEASQIPTSEAVGALFRADSFVIAGDEEQMPPSNYFVTSLSNQDDGSSLSSVDEDLESLLDDAIVLRLPRKRLTWHYRSRHESLISFSNNRFYGNSLLTFPSPSSEKGSVSFRLVKGAYERGRGINRPSAKAIVAEIVKRLKDPLLRKKSIGVITFNEAEQNLVEDILEKELAANPRLDSAPGGEKIFVKNLENVQGDERDVILFDITYGPDKNGELSLNFGPLSLKKGERRLNVAVSRARETMIVFSSFDPSLIRAERAKNEGASYLRDFLYFAKGGFDALPIRYGNENPENRLSVASFLASDLRKNGYTVTENLGNGSFKIDLAIASKEDPDDYVLGVLFDSPYIAKMSCRDRHVNEPSVLKRLSWNLISLYGVEYLDHRDEVLKAVVNAYNDALSKKENEEEKTASNSPLFIKKPRQTPKNFRPYSKMPKTKKDGCYVETSFLQDVINTEYPISAALLDKRICDAYGYGRIGSNIRNQISECLMRLSPGIETCGSRTFYYPRYYDAMNYRFWRKSDENVPERRIVDIGFIEIGNCAADILLEQGAMSLDDLAKSVSTAFGYSVLSKSANDYLKQGIRWNDSTRLGIYIDDNGIVSLR